MPHSDNPLFEEFLQELFTNYDPFIIPPDEPSIFSTSPLSFYDWHIASNLTLEHIIYFPSITQSFSKICDGRIKDFLQHDYKLSCDDFPYRLSISSGFFDRVRTVRKDYQDEVAEICYTFASKLVLHPFHKPWDSPFLMGFTATDYPPCFGSYLTWSGTAKSGKYLSDTTANQHLLEASRNRIFQLANKYPRLATFTFFIPTDSVVRMFKTVTNSSPFPWTTPKTIGRRTVSYIRIPPDSNLETIIPKSKKMISHSSTVINGNKKTRTAKKIIPSKPSRASSRPDLRQHIQRAWAECVANDSSFFVLHCGRYERIGFRHRASQTLYLSGVIDTVNSQQPSYRKIHAGLFMTIIQDAIRRQEVEESPRKSNGKKRSAEVAAEMVEPARKKQKKMEDVKVSSDGIRIDEILLIDGLALIELNYGIYYSPKPSSFFRVGAREIFWPRCEAFEGDDYFTLTLQESTGSGAVGVIHPAIVEATTTKSGETLRRSDLIVKFAFQEDQQEKLQQEYRMYELLRKKGVVEGVIPVYGLFRDSDTGTLAMIMDHAGDNLLVRQSKLGITLPNRRVYTSPVEKEAFQRVLKGIHAAGILHGDIRQENMLIGPDNKVFIIDLDMAVDTTTDNFRLSAPKELSREMHQLQHLLEID